MSRSLPSIGLALLPTLSAFAWYGHDVTTGPLRLLVEEITEVTDVRADVPVEVLVENVGANPLRGHVTVRDLVDDWRVAGEDTRPFDLAAGASVSLGFHIRTGPFVFSALYPVHAYATFRDDEEAEQTVHAVRVFSVKAPRVEDAGRVDGSLQANELPAGGILPLWLLRTQRVCWRYYDQPPVFKAPGWTGSDPTCRASMETRTITRGEARACINMHPPWVPGGGTILCDYWVTLPNQAPIKLLFANAIRDSSESEPASDGVLFRVWVSPDADGADSQAVFERFTAAKTWEPGEADLSAFAGQTVLLRLESHPGPERNTTCDSSYWAEPTLVAGKTDVPARVTAPTPGETAEAERKARDLLAGRLQPNQADTLLLAASPAAERAAVVITPGPQGLLDALVTLATAKGTASFRGFIVDVDDLPAGRWPPAYVVKSVVASGQAASATWLHTLAGGGEDVPLSLTVSADGPALRVSASCSKRISQFSVGPWNRSPQRVYYGHGYCIEKPKAFRAGFGGHNLASSHIGCDFRDGPSVLQAVDTPPDALSVNPADGTCALITHMDCVLTLVPGDSAFACAVAYRPLHDKKPSAGVERLAGRFLFDIWGGRYADIAENMARMVRYGLSDSIMIVHNWQRWGYDYRLPDVHPPNPAMGTVEDMRRIASVCAEHDVPWGLHDNYIDFYPDAKDYSYRHVYFTRDGRPHPAWYNQGRDAQSYKWRPDHILAFVRRNLQLVKQDLYPTASFLDVFTSSGCMDYWDHDGGFHSSLETRKHWGEAFAWIRDYLGGNAPTTSEAGHDQLIGALDGADCQWLSLSAEADRFVIKLPCEDWERVPWYDAVNHHRFVLQGVGYSGRYQGGQSRELHGINSDDYISAEILSGHALMVDAGSWGRDAVRKYYLAQDVARDLALRQISDVAFAGDDSHRQRVTWDNGTVVHVNRGTSDWTVGGRVLPQYGFLVEYGAHWAAIEKREGLFIESSRGPSGWFCNARTHAPGAHRQLAIGPRIENFRDNGGGTFEWELVWAAERPAPENYSTFVHFCSDRSKRRDGIEFQDDHPPPRPTTEWTGTLRVRRTVTVPEDADGEYKAMVGLYNSGGRAMLRGKQGGESRVWVGSLRVKRAQDAIAEIVFVPPPPPDPQPERRTNPPGTVVDFGFAATDGAFRVEPADGGVRVVPLPGRFDFGIRLTPTKLGAPRPGAKSITAVDMRTGQQAAAVRFETQGATLSFRHEGQEVAYLVRW